MSAVLDWKFDACRAGYVHCRSGQFVSYEDALHAGVFERSTEISRRFGIFAAVQYTFHQIAGLAESLAAQERARGWAACGVCEGAGMFRHALMLVGCSVCGGTGRFRKGGS